MLRRSGRVLFGRPGHIRRPLIFLFVIGLAASLASGSFLTLRNITALLTSSSFLVVASVGEAFVVMVGMIDLGRGEPARRFGHVRRLALRDE